MRNLIRKIQTWINGFRKLEYNYPLWGEFTRLPVLSNRPILSVMPYIKNIPIYNVHVSVNPFVAEKVTRPNYKIELIKSLKSLVFTKVSCEYFRINHTREITVVNTVYSLGIDCEVWKFTFKTHLVCTCYSNEFDLDLINACNACTRDVIKSSELHLMLQTGIEIPELLSMDLLHTRTFDGYVKTYGDEEKYEMYGLDDLCPLEEDNDATSIPDAIHENTLEEYLKENAMIVDVIRKSAMRNEETI